MNNREYFFLGFLSGWALLGLIVMVWRTLTRPTVSDAMKQVQANHFACTMNNLTPEDVAAIGKDWGAVGNDLRSVLSEEPKPKYRKWRDIKRETK